jgi:phage FluMu protein Com
MEDIRCGQCHRKLAEIDGEARLAIKCPRCKAINFFAGRESRTASALERRTRLDKAPPVGKRNDV